MLMYTHTHTSNIAIGKCCEEKGGWRRPSAWVCGLAGFYMDWSGKEVRVSPAGFVGRMPGQREQRGNFCTFHVARV